MVKWVGGISRLWRFCHYVQSNLTQHWRAGVLREQFVDVFHDFWVYIYQLYVSSTQTTPGRRRSSHLYILPQLFSSIFATLIAVNVQRSYSAIAIEFLHAMVTGIENSLSHEAFGCRVKGGQFHCVTIRGAHLKQNPLVREKLTLLAKNTFLIDLG